MSGLRFLRMALCGGPLAFTQLPIYLSFCLEFCLVPLCLFSHLQKAETSSGCRKADRQLTTSGGWGGVGEGPDERGERGQDRFCQGLRATTIESQLPVNFKQEILSMICVAGKMT